MSPEATEQWALCAYVVGCFAMANSYEGFKRWYWLVVGYAVLAYAISRFFV